MESFRRISDKIFGVLMTTYTMSRALNGVLQKRCCHESVLFSAYIACQNCVKVEDAKAMPFQLYLAIHNSKVE